MGVETTIDFTYVPPASGWMLSKMNELKNEPVCFIPISEAPMVDSRTKGVEVNRMWVSNVVGNWASQHPLKVLIPSFTIYQLID
jgi:hypothetical protein